MAERTYVLEGAPARRGRALLSDVWRAHRRGSRNGPSERGPSVQQRSPARSRHSVLSHMRCRSGPRAESLGRRRTATSGGLAATRRTPSRRPRSGRDPAGAAAARSRTPTRAVAEGRVGHGAPAAAPNDATRGTADSALAVGGGLGGRRGVGDAPGREVAVRKRIESREFAGPGCSLRDRSPLAAEVVTVCRRCGDRRGGPVRSRDHPGRRPHRIPERRRVCGDGFHDVHAGLGDRLHRDRSRPS